MPNDGNSGTSTQDVLKAATGTTSSETKKALYAERPTAILHRTPWRPPVASKAHGMEITLEDGRVLLDAVGGAAVACIGMGNERVKQAIKDQVDECACKPCCLSSKGEHCTDTEVIRCVQYGAVERAG